MKPENHPHNHTSEFHKYNPPRPKGIDENSMENLEDPKGVKFDHWDPNQGAYFTGKEIKEWEYTGNIYKVNGVDAYSQPGSLYKGEGSLQEFVPQPGLDVETGTMPPGEFNPEPAKTYVERDKFGFEPYPSHPMAQKHPKISPPAGWDGKTTVYNGAIHTTYRDLKEALNMGMGSRTNKFLLELDMPIRDYVKSSKLNILCQEVSFPQRNISTATIWRFGRKYVLRGETDFGNSWTVTFVDDSKLLLRSAFDDWLQAIDDSKLQNTALDAVGRENDQWVEEKIRQTNFSGKTEYELWKKNQYDYISRFRDREFDTLGRIGFEQYKEYENSYPNYQTDIRIYQLDATGNKVMGYLMQNAFPTEVSNVQYSDSEQNSLVNFSVTFSYSEFLPLKNEYLNKHIGLDGNWP